MKRHVIPGLESSDLWPHRSKPPKGQALQRSRLPMPGIRDRLPIDADTCSSHIISHHAKLEG
jgi:hypothetical protein